MAEIKEREPLFHVTKRSNMPLWQTLLIRVAAFVLAMLLGISIMLLSYRTSIYESSGIAGFFADFGNSFKYMLGGIINTTKIENGTWSLENDSKLWDFLLRGALLLGVGLALIPSFKMKFWNLGGNGQILVGVLVSAMIMFELGTKAHLPDFVLWIIMVPSAIIAGAIWAVIPAIFKALFNTNESLFTLMMNYVAMGITGLYLTIAIKSGSGTMMSQRYGRLPILYKPELLPAIIVLLVLAFIVYYLKFSKHGYELSVVGESVNTARYVGINVKKVIIRTLLLSGALCGLIGLLIGGAVDYTVTELSDGNMGFTAIMAVWLAKTNPAILAFTSFFIVFITKGMSQVQSQFGITNTAIADMVIGLVYFFIIGCEFFIEYKIAFNKGNKQKNPMNVLNNVVVESPQPAENPQSTKEEK